MWTDERVELLKKLWAEGLSASQVAKQLGGVTRNAVIGKVHRLGLSGRATPSRPARSRAPAPRTLVRGRPDPLTAEARGDERQREAAAERAEAAHVEERGLEPIQRATVLTLTEHTCKWPIGDPGRPGFHFCGRGAEHGAPYCTEHARMAYQPAQARRNRERDRMRRDRLVS
ncbi:GcrA cell cycle regulator [Parvibaculum lavamentivorans DS-1]|uniref:GcrA cell cycle regulator n=1 Tax=Parvibaculum lavamentivorans (strain DS-1 / DSM 13023 / NCIMB 13966) TaxID=402881 RepID=A7HQ40_PARL1|nr:GcrA cell cycle regulator [Parvibaculum lavamentivorans DS-1]